jgi:hypothetical protein
MRSYEMTEIGARGLEECLVEASGSAWDRRQPLLDNRPGPG